MLRTVTHTVKYFLSDKNTDFKHSVSNVQGEEVATNQTRTGPDLCDCVVLICV